VSNKTLVPQLESVNVVIIYIY